MSLRDSRPQRSAMFFNSDVAINAETTAGALGHDFGLTEDQTTELSQVIETAIHDYFQKVRA